MEKPSGNCGGQEREKAQIARRKRQISEERSQKRRAGERKGSNSPPEMTNSRRENPKAEPIHFPASYSVPCWRPGCRGRAPQDLHEAIYAAEWPSCVQYLCDNGEPARSVQFPVIGTMYIRRRAKMSRGPWNTAASRSKNFL